MMIQMDSESHLKRWSFNMYNLSIRTQKQTPPLCRRTSEIVPRYTLSSLRYVFITFQHSCPIEAHSDVVESFPRLLAKVRQTDPRNEYRGAEEPL